MRPQVVGEIVEDFLIRILCAVAIFGVRGNTGLHGIRPLEPIAASGILCSDTQRHVFTVGLLDLSVDHHVGKRIFRRNYTHGAPEPGALQGRLQVIRQISSFRTAHFRIDLGLFDFVTFGHARFEVHDADIEQEGLGNLQ